MAAAVVSTVRFPPVPAAAEVLLSWIGFHLLKGFEGIWLFFDSPEDPSRAAVEALADSRIRIFVQSAELLALQSRTCACFDRFGPLASEEVQARQCLNAELAAKQAREVGFSWLVHIDSDELFFTAAESVKPHFASLGELGVSQMTYLNHEGVPVEGAGTDDGSQFFNYFTETTLFRRHHFSVPLTRQTHDCIQFWRSRSSKGQYLLCYDNGKSAVRIDGEPVTPASVHKWVVADPKQSFTALVDSRDLDMGKVLSCADPCILHFVTCGYSWFLAKYAMLGDFPDTWFNGALKIEPSFHLDSRDVCVRGDMSGPERSAATRAFYTRHVCVDGVRDAAELERQLKSGVCVEVSHHRDVAAAFLSVHCPGRRRGPPLPPPMEFDDDMCDAPAAPAVPAPPSSQEKSWLLSRIAREYLGQSMTL